MASVRAVPMKWLILQVVLVKLESQSPEKIGGM
jgi:hypothetical protein